MADTANIISALRRFFPAGWEFLVLPDASNDELTAAANFVETQGSKFLIADSDDTNQLANLEGLSRSILTQSSHDQGEPSYLPADLIGNVASKTVGSQTWNLQGGLKHTTPQDQLMFQGDQLKPLRDMQVITYAYQEGLPATTSGKTASGQYIDILHGVDWIRSELKARITAKMIELGKVPFDVNGINVVTSVADGVMTDAFDNGIIALNEDTKKGDYKLTSLQRDQLNPTDVSDRLYKGLGFEYRPSGAIEKGYIQGYVQL